MDFCPSTAYNVPESVNFFGPQLSACLSFGTDRERESTHLSDILLDDAVPAVNLALAVGVEQEAEGVAICIGLAGAQVVHAVVETLPLGHTIASST